jgi:hypothetical protein
MTIEDTNRSGSDWFNGYAIIFRGITKKEIRDDCIKNNKPFQ